MESKAIKTTYGQCRCCLAKGQHRSIMKEYFFNGIREVYHDIFKECFNLFLSTDIQVTSLICTTCIQRLRDATSFRMMVSSTERQLLKMIDRNDSKDMCFVNVPIEENMLEIRPDDVKLVEEKLAEVKEEINEDEGDFYDSDYVPSDTPSDDIPLQETKNRSDLDRRESALLARFKSKPPRLPDRTTLADICPSFCAHLDNLRDKTVFARDITKMVDDHHRRQTANNPQNIYINEKAAHIQNASTLLLYSNMTPFRSKSRCGFPCFYCRNIFDNFDKLREHTSSHKKSDLKKILATFGSECLVVYADITDLKCSLCEKNIPSINELKSHLINVHNKKMHSEFNDRVIPYKMPVTGVSECQMCGFNFETFGAIERHMNVHFRNYVCKDCGTGFVTRYRLKVHVKSMHSIENVPCEVCGKIFATHQKHKNHVNAVHKMVKRFKCAKCPERFAEYFTRQKHMVQIHGVAPLKYNCNVCEKSFDRRYTLSRHMKRDHLEERDYQCELCSYKCFTKNELTVHMVKHNGERIFECSVCKKSYARKKTLKEHMRIHNNDRRFACAVCGQAFVQKCSLKGHLKTHHLEFSLQ